MVEASATSHSSVTLYAKVTKGQTSDEPLVGQRHAEISGKCHFIYRHVIYCHLVLPRFFDASLFGRTRSATGSGREPTRAYRRHTMRAKFSP